MDICSPHLAARETNIDGTKPKVSSTSNTYQQSEMVAYAQVNKKKPPTSEKPTLHTQPPVPASTVDVDEDDKSYEGETSYKYLVYIISWCMRLSYNVMYMN